MAVKIDPTRGFRYYHSYFHSEVSAKDVSDIIKGWIKKRFSPLEAKAILANPEYHFSAYNQRALAALWDSKGYDTNDPLCSRYIESIGEIYKGLVSSGQEILNKKTSHETKTSKIIRSPYELTIQKVEDTILKDIDEMEDQWIMGDTSGSIDMYKAFRAYDLKGTTSIDRVHNHVSERLNELYEVLKGDDIDMVEGYSNIPKSELNRRIKCYEKMIKDLDSLRTITKAQRKPKKAKDKGADKQVSALKYQRENTEYRIASIDPVRIPGTMRLYTFNAKTRVLHEYVSTLRSGFSVKGTTLHGYDPDQSRSTKLRKPMEFLDIVMTKTPRQIDKEWGKLTTKTSTDVSGRINEDTILLRVLDK